MKIDYVMADGSVQKIEVNESVGQYLLKQEQESRNFKRNLRRRNECSVDLITECGVDIVDKKTNIEKQIIDKTIIEQAFLELKEKNRRIAIDIFVNECPPTEEAKILNISIGSMSKRVSRIRNSLISNLEKHGYKK